jgi:hypothetical protein
MIYRARLGLQIGRCPIYCASLGIAPAVPLCTLLRIGILGHCVAFLEADEVV